MTFVIKDRGLSVTVGRSVSLVPWTSLRYLHLLVTSGVGTTGFPVYGARLRTLFSSREISSLDWLGERRVDRSADYVRFVEKLIPFAAERNPSLRLRYGGDPMLEMALPMVLSIFFAPLFFMLFIFVKLPLGVHETGSRPVRGLAGIDVAAKPRRLVGLIGRTAFARSAATAIRGRQMALNHASTPKRNGP